jgi:hypothetical protein
MTGFEEEYCSLPRQCGGGSNRSRQSSTESVETNQHLRFLDQGSTITKRKYDEFEPTE